MTCLSRNKLVIYAKVSNWLGGKNTFRISLIPQEEKIEKMNTLKKVFSSLLLESEENILFKPTCIDDTLHYKIERNPLYLDSVIICSEYKSIKSLLERYKYQSFREESRVLLPFLVEGYKFLEPMLDNDVVITWVPMHWSRYFLRGFNHIELLAKLLAKKEGISYRSLLRAPFRFRQSKQSREKRLEKKFGNFVFRSNMIIPKSVILIDDVISTWSTANACAKSLKDAWVEKVYGLFLASNKQLHVRKNWDHPSRNSQP